MSLANPDEEYEDLIETKGKKRRGKGRIGKLFKISKFTLILLIIGIILGILFGHYFVEPFLQEEEASVCKNCLETKEILTKENDCLYSILDAPQEEINKCVEKT
jgi:nitrogen fixation/metabolism regulation signal transduction histidine kinase